MCFALGPPKFGFPGLLGVKQIGPQLIVRAVFDWVKTRARHCLKGNHSVAAAGVMIFTDRHFNIF